MNVYVYPYKAGSASAKALADGIGAKRIKREGSNFRGGQNKRIINWGNSDVPNTFADSRIINPPDALQAASNKLSFFRLLEHHGANHLGVPFTADREVVQQWLDSGGVAVARTKLTGHSGAGIVLIHPDDPIVEAPLYTLYKKKKSEFRVHVSVNGIFDIQQKKRSLDVPDNEVDWKIRNHQNGFIYGRDDIQVPENVKKVASEVFSHTRLDFAAIDIIYNENEGRAYVLEINSAPGLEGTTLMNYVSMIRGLL